MEDKKIKMDPRCPRGLEYLPCTHCPMGKNKADRMESGRLNMDTVKDNECIWYINNSDSNYCYFKYIKDLDLGCGKTHTLKEASDLLSTSINNIKLRETEALKFLKSLFLKKDPNFEKEDL